MKPVAIVRHYPIEGPGYFARFLDEHAIPWRLIAIDEGEAVPRDAQAWSGLCFMGGPMSANDELPWIAEALALMRDARAADVPLLGHCLGGQLMARAFGGVVTRNPVKEIGWGRVEVVDRVAGARWFGDAQHFEVYHWHGETFSIPPGAQHLLASPHCAHQAYALGKHFGLQCHVEMTEELVRAWCAEWGADVDRLAARAPSVQTAAEMTRDLPARVAASNRIAATIYGEWIQGLRP